MYRARAAWSRLFCLEPEPTQFVQSRNRLQDLGLPEPEPPKKVAAPQHWLAPFPPPPSWAYGAISFLGYSGTVFTQVLHSSTVFRNRVRITEDLLHCENWTFFHFFPPNSPFTDYGLVKQQLRENSVCLLAQICLCYIT